MYTKEREAEVLFVLALLEDSFGGLPSLGIVANGTYEVFSSCMCVRCKTFRQIYPPKSATNLIAAAKLYGDDRLCFNQTEEMMNSRSRIH